MRAPSPAPARLAVVGGRVHRTPSRVEHTDLHTDGPVIVAAPGETPADPAGLRAVVVDGTVVVRDGAALRPRGTSASGAALATDDPRLGAWRDDRRDMTQHLTPDGRYSETRGGVRDAYTGSFWLDGDRITY